MIVRQTTLQEARRVNEIFAIAFESPMTDEPVITQNDRCHTWASFLDDDRTMMSTLTVTDYRIRFDGHSCRMGGVGGVATLPQYRRMGGIRRIFETVLPHMHDNGYDFSYLYPFSTAYYRKFGYECCVQKYGVAVLLSLLNPPAVSGSFQLGEQTHPLTDAIRRIDAVWEQKYNMMVQHSADDYQWAEKSDPAVRQEFTYVYFASDGTPKAYTTFHMAMQADGRNLICSRFCFLDQEGFQGLMHLFKSLSSDHMYVKFHLPNAVSMQYLMPEWSLGVVSWSVHPAGMVRVVNVRSVLEKARYLGSGTVTLEILDRQIPRNNGRFTVTFCNGTAASVVQTDRTPDAVLSISAFSALISGVCGFEDAAQWFDRIQINAANCCLNDIFYRKNMMIVDNF